MMGKCDKQLKKHILLNWCIVLFWVWLNRPYLVGLAGN